MLVAVLHFFIRYYLEVDDPASLLSVAIVGLFLSGFASIPLWKLVASRGRAGGRSASTAAVCSSTCSCA